MRKGIAFLILLVTIANTWCFGQQRVYYTKKHRLLFTLLVGPVLGAAAGSFMTAASFVDAGPDFSKETERKAIKISAIVGAAAGVVGGYYWGRHLDIAGYDWKPDPLNPLLMPESKYARFSIKTPDLKTESTNSSEFPFRYDNRKPFFRMDSTPADADQKNESPLHAAVKSTAHSSLVAVQ